MTHAQQPRFEYISNLCMDNFMYVLSDAFIFADISDQG